MSHRSRARAGAAALAALLALGASAQPAPSPGAIETLRAIGGLPPHICNVLREPAGLQQSEGGVYYLFDRRGHAVYTADPAARGVRKVVEIGGEGGRLLEPTAFDVAPDGTFAVADAPNGRERLQVFDVAGTFITGFTLPGRAATRLSINGVALGGVTTLAFLGRSVVLNQPETGSLITEYGLAGTPIRSIGALRATGHESDRQLHLAMNAGIPVPVASGGFFFVFYSGAPLLQRYDASGTLLYERVIQGREMDQIQAQMPRRWPRRSVSGDEIPLVAPAVRTAAADGSGNLWVTFAAPVTYVYDRAGEKIRTIQFEAAGRLSPTSLFFTAKGRLLVTPGCYEFAPW